MRPSFGWLTKILFSSLSPKSSRGRFLRPVCDRLPCAHRAYDEGLAEPLALYPGQIILVSNIADIMPILQSATEDLDTAEMFNG